MSPFDLAGLIGVVVILGGYGAATLDPDHSGYLTLAALPKTLAQRMLEARAPSRRP